MSMFTLGASRPALRITLTALFLIVPVTAFAVDNDTTGAQAECKQRATSDYQTNLQSCSTNLAGDPQAITQCQEDFSYEYEQALHDCESAAHTGGGRLHDKFSTGQQFEQTQTVPGKSHAKGLKFNRN